MSMRLELPGTYRSVGEFVRALERAVQVTEGDALLVLHRKHRRIREMTGRGLDYSGRAFAPYSKHGPYYLYPDGNTRGAPLSDSARRSRNRRARVLEQAGLERVSRTGKGIRFEHYGAAKSAHGRSRVDLFGLGRGPHMLNEIVAEVRGRRRSARLLRAPEPAQQMSRVASAALVIDGEAGERAEAHNEGRGRQPQRRFMDWAELENRDNVRRINERRTFRGRRVVRGERI